MAITDKWITPDEMRQVIRICQALDKAWETIQANAMVSVPFLEDAEGMHQTMPVYDSNGDVLGHIGFTETGFGLYGDDGSND